MTPLLTEAIPIATSATSFGFAADLLLILACAGVVAAVLGRVRIAVIPGFLIAGAIIGPGALGLIDDAESIGEITSIATVLLMFGIGLHLDTSVLRKGAISIIAAGLLTTLGTVLIFTPIAMGFGLNPPSAIAVAMAVSMSSTAVVMRSLQQKRELYSAHGRLSFGVLLVQDLLIIIMLGLLPMLAKMGHAEGLVPTLDPSTLESVTASGQAEGVLVASPPIWVAFIAVAMMLVLGKVALPRFMTMIAKGRNDEVLLVIASAVALGAAVLTGYVGLSPELGAFLAGFLLSATPFRYQLSGQISPIRDLFMAVFFTAVGLELNLTGIVPDLPLVLACTALVILIKSSVIASIAWAVGASVPIAVRAGLALAQAGEFSLLLVASATGLGLLDEKTGSILIATIVLTLVLTPSLDTLGARISRRILHLPPAPWFKRASIGESRVLAGSISEKNPEGLSVGGGEAIGEPCRVIIAGFGPVGRACADRLDREGVRATIVELNPKTVRTQAALGRSIIYGDITNPEVLENAGLDDARAVLITMPDHEAMLRAVSVIRRHRPDIYIAVRANLLSWANRARELGADYIAVEEIAVADQLARHAIDVAEGSDPVPSATPEEQ